MRVYIEYLLGVPWKGYMGTKTDYLLGRGTWVPKRTTYLEGVYGSLNGLLTWGTVEGVHGYLNGLLTWKGYMGL